MVSLGDNTCKKLQVNKFGDKPVGPHPDWFVITALSMPWHEYILSLTLENVKMFLTKFRDFRRFTQKEVYLYV